MGLLDGILGQLGGAVDIGSIAQKYGIPAELAEKAVAALGASHAEPGDTIEGAAAKTGLDSGILGQIAGSLGGEGGLGQLSDLMKGAGALGGLGGLAGMLGGGDGKEDEGGMLGNLSDLAGGLLGGKN